MSPDAGADAGLAERIRVWGAELGFSRVGFAPAARTPESGRLLSWLERGYHGNMAWMARDPEARIDPERILAGMRSAVVVSLNYRRPGPETGEDGAGEGHAAGKRNPAGRVPRISCYAWGDDYHEILREKLKLLAARIEAAAPGTRTRLCCDTSPVMDKEWAVAGGLGWRGRNTCLIDPRLGSWLFLGEIFLDRELPADPPVADLCGTCRRCLDVCPTGALVEPYVLDSRRCISYLTIEHRGEFDPVQEGSLHSWLVGCDLCQEVCPWNGKAPLSCEERFSPRPDLTGKTLDEWAGIGDEEYRDLIRGTALTRIRPADMRRNARAIRP